MTALEFEIAAEKLAGLSLGEAFLRHVFQNDAVVEASKHLLLRQPKYASVFAEGMTPGPAVNFYWSLHVTAAGLAYDFGRPIMYILDGPPHRPSDLETAAATAIAQAVQDLRDMLQSGALVAVGTFTGTGVEVSIGVGQWKRKDIIIDIENSAICEGEGHRPRAVWTGVRLETAAQRESFEKSVRIVGNERFPKTRNQVSTKEKSRRECLAYILSLVSDPDADPLSKNELWKRVKEKWPDKIGVRQFDESRRDALKQVNEEQRILWTRPGPRGKRS